MKNRIIFIASILGVVIALVDAYVYSVEKPLPPPVFSPATNPYDKGIYANGIIESYQDNGQNINIFPEVAGTVVKILVKEGDAVAKDAPLLILDGSVQRATGRAAEIPGHRHPGALGGAQGPAAPGDPGSDQGPDGAGGRQPQERPGPTGQASQMI